MMNIFEYLKLGIKHRGDPFFYKWLKGKHVLDVGSGQGLFLIKDPKNFVGIELNPILVEKSLANGLNVHAMSALEIRFNTETFDAIHAAQLIEHFNPGDAYRFLIESQNVLKKGGIIFLTTPGVKTVWNTFSHIRPYPPSAFAKLLIRETEGYLNNDKLSLALVGYWGQRNYFRSKILTFLSGALDILIPPKNPIGWIIILKKI